jgi:hypothetical protein
VLLAAAILAVIGFGAASRAQGPYEWASWCGITFGECDTDAPERADRRTAKTGPTGKPAPVAMVDRALLTPQPEPNCEYKGSPAATSEETLRAKLDYERQCYRHAEIIARNRLRLLQASVEDTMTAAKRGR